MCPRKYRIHTILTDFSDNHIFIITFLKHRHQHQIQIPFFQRFQQHGWTLIHKFHCNIRIFFIECLNFFCHSRISDTNGKTNIQRTDNTTGCLSGSLDRSLHPLQQQIGFLQKHLSCRSQHNFLFSSFKQTDTKLFLQRLDLLSDCRL